MMNRWKRQDCPSDASSSQLHQMSAAHSYNFQRHALHIQAYHEQKPCFSSVGRILIRKAAPAGSLTLPEKPGTFYPFKTTAAETLLSDHELEPQYKCYIVSLLQWITRIDLGKMSYSSGRERRGIKPIEYSFQDTFQTSSDAFGPAIGLVVINKLELIAHQLSAYSICAVYLLLQEGTGSHSSVCTVQQTAGPSHNDDYM